MTHRFFVSSSRLRRVAFSSLSLLCPGLLLPGVASGQDVPPPPLPPPATDEPTDPAEPEQDAEPSATPDSAPPPLTEEPPPVMEPAPEDDALEVTQDSETATAAETPEEWRRRWSTRRQTTIYGSTGVHRVREAGSGAAGTFRVHLLGSYFSGNSFLCSEEAPCYDEFGQNQGTDKAQRSTFSALISATPLPFLEAYVGLHNSATTNTKGRPQGLLVVGDTSLGLKGFLPDKLDRIYSFGGELEVGLLTGTGGLSLAGGAVNFALRALGTLDLNNRTEKSKRIPLRVHANIGYQFDNTSKIVEDLEHTPPPNGRGEPIERTERYGLGIARVDSLDIGLAAEYVHDYVRPFVEYTIDIPVNRQGYVCNLQGANSRGDHCLGQNQTWGFSPNRFSLGANVFPWQATGLSLKVAMDIGAGGKKRFLEETTPESPWALWFGLGYVVDTVKPKPRTVSVADPTMSPPETRRYIAGIIVDEKEGKPIAHAIIHYQDVPMTGLVASSDGQFISQDLPPGEYAFKISAEGYEEGVCTASIPESAPPESTLAAATDDSPATPSAAASSTPDEASAETEETAESESEEAPVSTATPEVPYTDADGNLLVPTTCKLKELPQITTITGLLVDSDTGGPVPDATVTITDTKNRSLTLEVDEAGSFQFRNVPFGPARMHATAPGYLPTVAPVLVDSRKELTPHLVLNARPDRLAVSQRGAEVRVERPLKFVGESTELTIKSMAMLEEVAVFLNDHPNIGNVEIQVHTDDSGAASYSRRLSQQRADRLMELLIQLGVKESRLTAKGLGPDQPLVPNVNDANREKNNRVQLMIVKE